MPLKPTQSIIAFFAIIAAIFLFLEYSQPETNGEWAKWAAIPIICIAAAWVMSPQIDFWFFKKNPPPLSTNDEKVLAVFPFYQKLSPELKKRFRNRVSLLVLGNAYMRPTHPEQDEAERFKVPQDLKLATAALATQVFFGKSTFLLGKFENFVLYPHPFPSPQFENMHTSEIFEEDGVVLLTADFLMQGYAQPAQFFSIGLYEMVRVFRLNNPNLPYPQLDENFWAVLEKISGSGVRTVIQATIGLDPDIFGVAGHYFFNFPKKMKQVAPEVYQHLSNIFELDTENEEFPVLGSNFKNK